MRFAGVIVGLAASVAWLVACQGATKDETGGGPAGSGGAAGGEAGGSGGGSGGVLTGSCATDGGDRCFKQAPGGCWCDGQCKQSGDCCKDYQATCASQLVELPAGCVTNSRFLPLCNPLTSKECKADEKCIFAVGGLECSGGSFILEPGADCGFPLPNLLQCTLGHACVRAQPSDPLGVCRRFCCSSADCDGAACAKLDPLLGSLGTCVQ